jgi:hypothetical protein
VLDRRIQQFCIDLSRFRGWRKLLDRISGLFLPPLATPGAGGRAPQLPPFFFNESDDALRNRESLKSSQHRANTPTTPYGSRHNTRECRKPRYRGMHGSPCVFHGGSDTQCPGGTVPGAYWSYTVDGIGEVYYVDCCGGDDNSNSLFVHIFCGWTNEDNWCYGKGNNIYTCTLALTDAELKTDVFGQPDPNFHITAGAASKLVTIREILEGWVSDDDVQKVVRILRGVPFPSEMKEIRDALQPDLNELAPNQRNRIRTALRRI